MMGVTVPPTGSLHDLSILIRFFGALSDADTAKEALEQCIAERTKAEALAEEARAMQASLAEAKRDSELAAQVARQAQEQAERSQAQAEAAVNDMAQKRQAFLEAEVQHRAWLDETVRQIEVQKELAAARIKEADQKVVDVDRVLGELSKDREHWASVNAEVEALKAELETKLAAIRAAAGV